MDLADDKKARNRIETSLDESLMVEAAAGTGKTTQLVSRLVAVLRTGRARVDRVVAVTFTRKAAGELKLKLRQELESARNQTGDPSEKANLEGAISKLEEARVGTIHGFCAELLRERPVEAEVDPAFEELSEDEAPRLFSQVFRIWIQEKLQDMPEPLSRALSRLATWTNPDRVSPLERLRNEAWRLAEWRDFPTLWRLEKFDRKEAIDQLVEEVAALAELSSRCEYDKDLLKVSLRPTRFFRRALEKAERFRPRDYDDLEAQLVQLLRDLKRDQRKGRGKFVEGATREEVLEYRDCLLQDLEGFQQQADADLAARLQREFREVLVSYEELKRRSGNLDFVDLLVRARDLLAGNRQVRRHLQQSFSHIFVDEFQDTDPLQAEILLLLAANDPDQDDWTRVEVSAGKLFLVGDPKQSIYRFRRADVLLYQKVKGILANAGVSLIYLSRNFRSVKPLQDGVNAAFEEAMREDPESGQPGYVPLLEHRGAQSGQPALVVLPAPEPFGWYNVTFRAVEECLPDTLAAFLDWVLRESHWKIEDPETKEESHVEARHVCILFRRFLSWGRDITRPYVRALDARRIPHVLVGSRTFHQREEVETLRAALTAVEWPDDELAVFATLKGSLFAIPDSLLLRFRKEIGSLHPFRNLPEPIDEDFQPLAEAMKLLAELHRRRHERPIVETITQILETTRAHAGFALRPAGDQVLANVQKVCDLARSYEMGGGISFRGFVERLNEEAEKPRSSEGPVQEEGAEGVRIMTLHAAKGLEFPVVVLADITCGLSSREPDKYVDLDRRLSAIRLLGCSPRELVENSGLEHLRDTAEGIRIAYVAATRARDLLIVPGVGHGQIDGWVSPLTPALYPDPSTRRQARPAPGCPEFGEVTVLAPPSRQEGPLPSSVRPGLHRPHKGDHEVVWWDPAALELDVEADFGIRQEEILKEEGPKAELGRQLHASWKKERIKAVALGSRPRFEILAPSDEELTDPPGAREIKVDFQRLAVKGGARPAGKRFGALVHTLLRDVDLEPESGNIEELARFHGRALEASAGEIAASISCVQEVLRHPLIERARQARACHKELPIMLHLDDSATIEGTLDLAFLEDEVWHVVDFKTDWELTPNRPRYERQVRWYSYALSRITGLPVRAYLLAM